MRRDVGANEASLPDLDAQDYLDEAAESYGAGTASSKAYARVLAIQGILASSAKLTAYRQNNTQESANQIFDHLKDLLAIWEAKSDKAVAADGGGGVRMGGMRSVPKRIREYPGGVGFST